MILLLMLFQLVKGQDANISQGLRGNSKQAPSEEENVPSVYDSEIRHKPARKMIRRKKKVHEQTATLETKRIWWLNHKRN